MDAIPVTDETLVIGVTQSGETADTMYSLCSQPGRRDDGRTDQRRQFAARECDRIIYIGASPKIFASQQVVLAMLSGATYRFMIAITGGGIQ